MPHALARGVDRERVVGEVAAQHRGEPLPARGLGIGVGGRGEAEQNAAVRRR